MTLLYVLILIFAGLLGWGVWQSRRDADSGQWLMILAVLSVSSGVVLDTVTRGRRELKLLAYLAQPGIDKG